MVALVVMPKKKAPTRYTPQQIEEFARSLRLVAERVEACSKAMKAEDIQGVFISSWRSGELAIKHWQSFSRSIHSGLDVEILRKGLED